MKITYKIKDTDDSIAQKIGPLMFVPDIFDHVTINGKRWTVDSREILNIEKQDVIVWLYDDTRKY